MSALDRAVAALEWAAGYGHPDNEKETLEDAVAARAELAALRKRCEAAEQVIRDANRIVGHDWFSCSRENRAKQAVFHAALDAYTKTYLADEARKALRGDTL